jgi:hypothetical protein
MTRRTPSQRLTALVEMANDPTAIDYHADNSHRVVTEEELDRLIDEWEVVREARKGGRS